MQLGNIVDELHDHHCFAHSGATEGAHLTSFEEGANQVDHLDTRGQDLRGCGLVHQRRSCAMNGITLVGLDGAAIIHRLACDIEDASHHSLADWHGDGGTAVGHFVATLETFGRGHGNGSNPVITQVLLDFQREGRRFSPDAVFHRQCVVNGWQLLSEFNIHHRANNLNDLAFVHRFRNLIFLVIRKAVTTMSASFADTS